MALTVYFNRIRDILKNRGGLMIMPKTYCEDKRESDTVDGYVMRNEEDGIEIECTKKFVKFWVQRGFVIKKEDHPIVKIQIGKA